MEKQIAGWLITHNEGQESKIYELNVGKNIIGRVTPNFTPEVPIEDTYVSRRHASLIVRLNEKNFFEYYIADNAEVNNGKPSMNGTYVNGNIQRIEDKPVKIIDGDTIQIGTTKLVLKSAAVSIDVEEAIKLVKKQEYQTTVDFVNVSKLSKKIRK